MYLKRGWVFSLMLGAGALAAAGCGGHAGAVPNANADGRFVQMAPGPSPTPAIIASIALYVLNATPQAGTALTQGLTVQARDASGKIISGDTPFANPITLKSSDRSGIISVTPTSMTMPNQSISVAYDGKSINGATISAQAAGVPKSKIINARLEPFPTVVGIYPIPTSTSDPFGLTTGPDGNMWFTEGAAGNVAKVTPAGQITEYPLGRSRPWGVTTGPDGNLWVAATDYIVSVSTSGTVLTQYNVHDPLDGQHWATELSGITTGADGALWFGEYEHGISRITTSGIVTRYTFPALNPGVSAVIAGPQDTIWTVEQSANRVASLSMRGHLQEYTIPTPQTSTVDIVRGKKNDFWFPEPYADKMGHITSSGVITEFTLPGTSGQTGTLPDHAVVDPDGNVWYAETGGIGKFSVDGSVTQYPLPRDDSPLELTIGPDGNIWFADITSQSGQIVERIVKMVY